MQRPKPWPTCPVQSPVQQADLADGLRPPRTLVPDLRQPLPDGNAYRGLLRAGQPELPRRPDEAPAGEFRAQRIDSDLVRRVVRPGCDKLTIRAMFI
ncbi:MAG TPA: hypothetical protein VN494_00310 [Patescibacteria group bacterium]|nr:hypothetical protein [Patescibacteria group bacterium]